MQACAICPAGTDTPSEGAVDCTCCGPGTYSPTAVDGCIPAPAGYFVNSTCATAYKACPLGSYAPDLGNDACRCRMQQGGACSRLAGARGH